MIELSATEWLQAFPRRGGAAGGAAPARAGAPVPIYEPARDPGQAGGSDRDIVEISAEGRRLQVKARVRSAVLEQLRLFAHAKDAERRAEDNAQPGHAERIEG